MNDFIPINYRDFWDVPRLFLVEYKGTTLLFDCRFNEESEDYESDYHVHEMPELTPPERAGSWANFAQRAVRLVAVIPVSAVALDPTRRRGVSAETIEGLFTAAG